MDSGLKFTIPEILALIGAAQSFYVVVYLVFRSGRIARGGVPMAYFFTLAAAFSIGFMSETFFPLMPNLKLYEWGLWTLQPILCALLIIQIAQIYKVPSLMHYTRLLLLPLAYGMSIWLTDFSMECTKPVSCPDFYSWLELFGVIAGLLSLGSIWFSREILNALAQEKNNKERYWLVLALLIGNVGLLATILLGVGLGIDTHEMELIKTLFGLMFVYLSTTSLFRIYPQAIMISERKPADGKALSEEEKKILTQIEDLIYLQKVYQEPSYSRSDLARECGAPEAIISKIINAKFGKSFPQLMNINRVEDAKRLLKQTKEPVAVIAQEVGFNSLATFNRVFKDVTGETPSQFRE